MIKNSMGKFFLLLGLFVLLFNIPTAFAQDTNFCDLAQEIEDGDDITEELDDRFPFASYCFEGDEDDVMRITVSTTDGDLVLVVVVSDPFLNAPFYVDEEADDEEEEIEAQFTLPDDGTYLIVISREGLDEGDTEGEFELEFQLRSSNNDDDEESSDLPSSLRDHDDDWQDAIEELEDEGVIGSGGSLILNENRVFADAANPGYVPIGSNVSRRDVVVATTIEFEAGSDGALCGISARNNDDTGLLLALSGDGFLLVLDVVSNDFYEADLDLDVEDENHLLFIAQDDNLSVYVNGDLALENVSVGDDSGSFTLFMDPDDEPARCDLSNFWAYEAPIVVAGLCEATSNNTVNRRSGPGTNFDRDGTLNAGERIEVVGQAEDNSDFTWYELDDGSWVREDVVSIVGDCSDIPESE